MDLRKKAETLEIRSSKNENKLKTAEGIPILSTLPEKTKIIVLQLGPGDFLGNKENEINSSNQCSSKNISSETNLDSKRVSEKDVVQLVEKTQSPSTSKKITKNAGARKRKYSSLDKAKKITRATQKLKSRGCKVNATKCTKRAKYGKNEPSSTANKICAKKFLRGKGKNQLKSKKSADLKGVDKRSDTEANDESSQNGTEQKSLKVSSSDGFSPKSSETDLITEGTSEFPKDETKIVQVPGVVVSQSVAKECGMAETIPGCATKNANMLVSIPLWRIGGMDNLKIILKRTKNNVNESKDKVDGPKENNVHHGQELPLKESSMDEDNHAEPSINVTS